jgi:hypothetical protein
MTECEIQYCDKEGKYYKHLNLTVCAKHKAEYEEELYWEQFYKEQRIGAYADKK